jgi:hypothetical protein
MTEPEYAEAPEATEATQATAPAVPTPSWRRRLTPIAGAVAAATFLVGGVSGYALGHSSASNSSQAGPGGRMPDNGQFPRPPGGSTGEGQGQAPNAQGGTTSGTSAS